MPQDPVSEALRGAHISTGLVGLLVYIVAIVTFIAPVGNLGIALALAGLAWGRDRVRLGSSLIFLAAFLLWAGLGVMGTHYPREAWATYEQAAKLSLIGFVTVNVLRSQAQIRVLSLVFLGLFLLFPVRGTFFNYWIYNYSLDGRAIWNEMYANPNELASISLLMLGLAASQLSVLRHWSLRVLCIAALVLLSLLVLMTQSRGAFLGLGVYVLLVVSAARGRRMRIVATGLIVALLALPLVPQQAWERFGKLRVAAQGVEYLDQADAEGSAAERFTIWRSTFQIIRAEPFVGVGLGTHSRVHAGYNPSLGPKDAHSTYFSVAAETGIPGALLFIGFLAMPVALAHRRLGSGSLPRGKAWQLRHLEFGYLGFLVAGIWGTYTLQAFTYLHAGLLWAAASAPHGPKNPLPPRMRHRRKGQVQNRQPLERR